MSNLDIDTAVSCMTYTQDPALDLILDAIDSEYRTLIKDIKNNTSISPDCKLLPSEKDNLSLEDNLVLLHSRRIVLPKKAIPKILELLHASHSGISKTITLAKGLYYWPGMKRDITKTINSCKECSLLYLAKCQTHPLLHSHLLT